MSKWLNWLFLFIFIIIQVQTEGDDSTDKSERRKLLHLPMESGRIYGNSYELWYYYAPLYFGNPPSKQTLIVDTGSSLVGFPCEESCTSSSSCGTHLNPYYSIEASTTSTLLSCSNEFNIHCENCNDGHCGYSQTYGEGSSYHGYFVNDIVFFGNEPDVADSVPFTFGCHNKETNYFYTQDADGILGLSFSKKDKLPPLYKTLYDSQMIDHETFSLCFGRDGGAMAFGGYNESLILPNSSMEYVPLQIGHYYYVTLSEIYIGATKVDVKIPSTFIDSGTTFTIFPFSVYNEFNKVMDAYCECTEEVCTKCLGVKSKVNGDIVYDFDESWFNDTKDFLRSFPIFTFVFNGKYQYYWYPSEYLVKDSEKSNRFILGISPGIDVMLAGTFIRHHMMYFDLENSQLGFAHATCSPDELQIVSPDELDHVELPKDIIKIPITTSNTETVIIPSASTSGGGGGSHNAIWIIVLVVIGSCLAVGLVFLVVCIVKYKRGRKIPDKRYIEGELPPVSFSNDDEIEVNHNHIQINENIGGTDVFIIDDDPNINVEDHPSNQKMEAKLINGIPNSSVPVEPKKYKKVNGYSHQSNNASRIEFKSSEQIAE